MRTESIFDYQCQKRQKDFDKLRGDCDIDVKFCVYYGAKFCERVCKYAKLRREEEKER